MHGFNTQTTEGDYRIQFQTDSRDEWLLVQQLCRDIMDGKKISQQQRWIPVTERLPEVRQWVLCQCRAGIIDVLRLTDDDCWYRKSNEIYMSGFVIAWMPMPEPWKNMRGEK